MIVVLSIKRSSGSTEVHELPAQGDYVEVPYGLLSSEDVLGFDIELRGPERCGFDLEIAVPDPGDLGGRRELFD